LPLINAN